MRSTHLTRGEIIKGKKILVMLHGRGSTASDIMSLYPHLPLKDFTLIGPQAPGYTWYPYSFLAPPAQNEPSLSNALKMIDDIVKDLNTKEILKEDIFFLGFSQGACLTLEFVTRNAARWGGVVAFTGGLIGDQINKANYKGDFMGTKIYIGSADPDPHVPVQRVRETEAILKKMGADVTVDIIQGMGHTINGRELEQAKTIFQPHSATSS
jgi:phospholipase/carboxylesterase